MTELAIPMAPAWPRRLGLALALAIAAALPCTANKAVAEPAPAPAAEAALTTAAVRDDGTSTATWHTNGKRGRHSGQNWEIRDGQLYVEGQRRFLKIAIMLESTFDPAATDRIIGYLDALKAKGYNAVRFDLYWFQYDTTGDGVPDLSLDPLRRIVAETERRSMFVIFSTQNYAVGGAGVPDAFLKAHPDAYSLNSAGKPIVDHEYGFMTAVPSMFSPQYLKATRTFIRSMVEGVGAEHIFFFESSVEPQYMGTEKLDYCEHARRTYEAWLAQRKLDGPAFPKQFPIPDSFVIDPTWNRFRAEYLASWVCEDIAVWRNLAGPGALCSVDYLETAGKEMPLRNGDSQTFLRGLMPVDIIEINWHWSLVTRQPNQLAYDNVRAVQAATGRDWIVTEHMTINGSDFKPEDIAPLLENTLRQGSRFSWEFVNTVPRTSDFFALYNDDWSPKPTMKLIDENWDAWMTKVAVPR